MKRCRLIPLLPVFLICSAALAQATAPATQPAVIDPRAAELLTAMRSAYTQLGALELAGSARGNFDVAGRKSQHEQSFTASYAAPSRFRHESKNGLRIGSSGESIYVYLPVENVYSLTDTPPRKLAKVPPPVANVLLGENPSLLMAIAENPTHFIEGHSSRRLEDASLDGKRYAVLRVERPTDDLTLLVDPDTHLLRRMTMDLRKTIAARGAPDIKSAEFEVDYETASAPADARPAEHFAWSPPPDARDVTAAPAGPEANSPLADKAAPPFVLKDLEGNEVKLADVNKGNVVLIDFWATWCPPCVAGMPNLERIHAQRAEEGVRVLAVNSMEEREKVAGFARQRGLTLPILLDADGKVGEAYGVNAWPTSVVVKRDGTIHKVLNPVGPEGEKALEAALNEALAEK